MFGRLGDGPGGECLACEDCEQDPALKARRGCLEAPVLSDGSRWDARSFVAERLADGWDRESIGIEAEELYEHADAGQVLERCGWLWDCCPLSVLLFGSPIARLVGKRALEMARARRGGDPTAGRGELTPAGLDLLELAHRLWGELERDDHDRRRQTQGHADDDNDDDPPRGRPVRRPPRR